MKNYVYTVCVGTYSEPILMGSGETVPGKGKGLYICGFDGERLSVIDALPMVNPSYACIDSERKIIYAVNEQKTFNGCRGGGFTQVRYSDSGKMEFVAQGNTFAEDPCHIEILPGKKFLSIANFSGSRVTFVPLDGEGNILPEKAFGYDHTGSGPEKSRQTCAHPHSTVLYPSGNVFYIPDLGEDRLAAYRFSDSEVVPAPEMDIQMKKGYGPRTGAFSPDGKHLYVICEIVNKAVHLVKNGETWETVQEESVVPEGHTGWSLSADLHLDPERGRLYISHRGSNTIAVFDIAPDGSMTKRFTLSSEGEIPRMFNISPDGRFLLCGNQDTDGITVFKTSEDTGLELVSVEEIPTPVFIGFIQ